MVYNFGLKNITTFKTTEICEMHCGSDAWTSSRVVGSMVFQPIRGDLIPCRRRGRRHGDGRSGVADAEPGRRRSCRRDEDITSIHTMNGPITRSRAR
jgi:hypothetical protein